MDQIDDEEKDEKLCWKWQKQQNIVVSTASSDEPDLWKVLLLPLGENIDEPDLLVLLGKAHLLVHVQVQHVLREQVHLKGIIIPQK